MDRWSSAFYVLGVTGLLAATVGLIVQYTYRRVFGPAEQRWWRRLERVAVLTGVACGVIGWLLSRAHGGS